MPSCVLCLCRAGGAVGCREYPNIQCPVTEEEGCRVCIQCRITAECMQVRSASGKVSFSYNLFHPTPSLSLPLSSTHTHVRRTLPLFVWHRQNWDMVYPHLDLEESELADLARHRTYVAGFTDPAVEGRTELYDLFINSKSLLVYAYSQPGTRMY